MRSLRPVMFGLLAVALAACTTTAPGWTYAPAPSATPPASVEPGASGEVSAPPSESAGTSAEPGGSAEPSAEPGSGEVVEIAAVNIAFDRSTLEVPADQPFQIVFSNNDPGIPHNVEIRDAAGTSVFMGEVFNGVETRTYDVPPLAAGSYQFLCTVHPNMTGTLTAG